MALSKQSLIDELSQTLRAMSRNYTVAECLAFATYNYANEGVGSTTDTGTVSAGAFTGASTSVTITYSSSKMQKVIYDKIKAMEAGAGADKAEQYEEDFAQAIADGLDAMVCAENIVTATVSGAAVSGSTTTPLTGSATGSITANSQGVVSSLKSCFARLRANAGKGVKNGDQQIVNVFADAVDAYFKSAIINTDGQGSLAGAKGTGAIS